MTYLRDSNIFIRYRRLHSPLDVNVLLLICSCIAECNIPRGFRVFMLVAMLAVHPFIPAAAAPEPGIRAKGLDSVVVRMSDL